MDTESKKAIAAMLAGFPNLDDPHGWMMAVDMVTGRVNREFLIKTARMFLAGECGRMHKTRAPTVAEFTQHVRRLADARRAIQDNEDRIAKQLNKVEFNTIPQEDRDAAVARYHEKRDAIAETDPIPLKKPRKRYWNNPERWHDPVELRASIARIRAADPETDAFLKRVEEAKKKKVDDTG